MHKRIIVAAALGSALAFSQIGVASAAGTDATVTANVTAGGLGSRSITSVLPIVLNPSAGVDTVQGSMTAVVAEAAVTGTTPWSVTTALTDLTQGADTLANSNVDIYGRSALKVLGGGTLASPSTTDPLSSTQTLFTNTGQSIATVYTGTYTATANLKLHVPNGTATGIYTGTMTVTLVQ